MKLLCDMKNIIIFGSALLFIAVIIACNDDSVESIINPYDSVNYGDTISGDGDFDSLSIVGLHHNIFKARCAVPGCHDGAFEPDFRTVQSTYSTLVYHPITKNNEAEEFQFRVVPFDPTSSVLMERLTNCCFVNQDDRMPQDNIGVPLESHYIESIRLWIENGARDIFDQVSEYPNIGVRVLFYVPLNEDFTVDFGQNRIDGYGSFIVPQNELVNMVVAVADDSTAVADLTNNRVELSTNIDDFSNATIINSQLVSGEGSGDQFYLTQFNSSDFPVNETIYFRIYSNDGEQPEDTEFPADDQQYFYKIYFSFIVQ